MSKSVYVKATLKQHHLLQIQSKFDKSLEDLKKDIRKSFPLLNQENITFKLYWTDDDGDRILLSTDEDLKQVLIQVDGKLNLEIEADVIQQPITSRHDRMQMSSPRHIGEPNRTSGYHNFTNMRSQISTEECNKSPPVFPSQLSQPDVGIELKEARYPPFSEQSISNQTQDSAGSSIVQQTSSASEQCFDQLDIPVDLQCLEGWPSTDTYALNMVKKMKRTLDQNWISDRTYKTDPDRQCRVLCILNKESRGKILCNGNGLDMECTYLQQLKKILKWDLQIHKNKTSDQIKEILNSERERDFTTVHSLFVIIITRGDIYGMFGTEGERIDYSSITMRFDEVEGLKGKPKIFFLDDCEIGSDIHDEASQVSTGIQESHISQNAVTYPKYVRTLSGREIQADERDATSIHNKGLDTYICKASSLGRCDKIVKGSWVIGALITVICKAGNKMTFQHMMREVDKILQDAHIPDGKPKLLLDIKDNLQKDFYLLPPPC